MPLGGEPTPKTFGFVVLNTPGDETTLTGEVALQRAAPNAIFLVFADEGSFGGCFSPPVGTITTNNEGNGNLAFTVARLPGKTHFGVEVLEESGGQSIGSVAVELD